LTQINNGKMRLSHSSAVDRREKDGLHADQRAPNNGWSVLGPQSDDDFQQGMTALLTPGNTIEQAHGVTEEIDWFVFLRNGWRNPTTEAPLAKAERQSIRPST